MNVAENRNASQGDAQADSEGRVEGKGELSSNWCSCDGLQ
tara:strand:+ start:63 stop:182 length:120 start_codon:yes stop_codon:yes gene_type:complete